MEISFILLLIYTTAAARAAAAQRHIVEIQVLLTVPAQYSVYLKAVANKHAAKYTF